MRDHKPIGTICLLFLTLILFSLSACQSAPEEISTEEGGLLAEPVTVMPESEPQPEQFEPEQTEPEQFEPAAEIAAPNSDIATPTDVPDRYVVVKGDTLWDISKRFLRDPWRWPEVWHINPAIRNPHLIYPGDVIVLYYVDGKPYLTLEGTGGIIPDLPPGVETIKLSPKARLSPLDKAITTLPRDIIAPFLNYPRFVTKEELEKAPYIVDSFERHLIMSAGYKIYARGIEDNSAGNFIAVRLGSEYRDTLTNELLGYEAINAADTKLLRRGDPASLRVTRARLEVFKGDKLLPYQDEFLDFNFFPRAPSEPVNGHIIAISNGVSQIGQFNVVILDRGKREGVEVGHVLAIYQRGEEIRDTIKGGRVKLPDERAGLLMVFRTYERISYGLVMEAQRPMSLHDVVRNP